MDKLEQFQTRFNKVKKDMGRWENLQRSFVSEFTNASYIILRFPTPATFLNLGDYDNFQEKLIVNQMDSLQTIMVSMKQTLDEFGCVVASFEKTVGDGWPLTKEVYRLKSSLFAALRPLTFNPNADDLSALYQILVDQPNVLRDKVNNIFDSLIFPENSTNP